MWENPFTATAEINEPTWLKKSYFTYANMKLMNFQSRLLCKKANICRTKAENWNDFYFLKSHQSELEGQKILDLPLIHHRNCPQNSAFAFVLPCLAGLRGEHVHVHANTNSGLDVRQETGDESSLQKTLIKP